MLSLATAVKELVENSVDAGATNIGNQSSNKSVVVFDKIALYFYSLDVLRCSFISVAPLMQKESCFKARI